MLTLKKRLWLTEDGRVVEDGHVDAVKFIGAEGSAITEALAGDIGLTDEHVESAEPLLTDPKGAKPEPAPDESDDESEPEAKAEDGPAETKAQAKPTATKAAKGPAARGGAKK